MFSLSLSVSFALSTASQNADVPCGPMASKRALLKPIGVCSAAEKCSIFLFMIASCTSFFVIRVMSGFVRCAPAFVVVVIPEIVIVDRGSRMDLSRARFISLHKDISKLQTAERRPKQGTYNSRRRTDNMLSRSNHEQGVMEHYYIYKSSKLHMCRQKKFLLKYTTG